MNAALTFGFVAPFVLLGATALAWAATFWSLRALGWLLHIPYRAPEPIEDFTPRLPRSRA